MMKNFQKISCYIAVLVTMMFSTAKADHGNFCFDADVPLAQDNLGAMCLTAPTLFCPATYLGCPSDNLDPSNTGYPNAQPGDASCPDPVVTFTDVVTTDTPCLKIIHRTWHATYPPGSASIKLHSTCQQTIYLEDNSAPMINNCPSDIVIDLSASCDSTAIWAVPTAEDDCGIQFFTTTHYSGSTFSSGTTPVTYTAQDQCGNVTLCEFNVTVTGSCCSEPVISCPADIVICPMMGTIMPSYTGIATASTTEPSCPTPSITFNDVILSSGPCSGEQEVQRTWTASDGTYVSSCNQLISVVDDTHPVITNTPSNINVSGTGNNCQVAVTWNAPSATDNCNISSFTSSHNSGDAFTEGNTTVTYTAIDDCGNATTTSFIVTVACACGSAPILTCPADYNACPSSPSTSPSVTGTATAVAGDPSCGAPVVTYTDIVISTGPCANETTIQRTWTATVQNNNSLTTQCVQLITISDNAVPAISNLPQNITLTGNGSGCSAVATWNAPTATDDCGLQSLTSNIQSGTTFNEGTTTVTYTAIDNCGNQTAQSFTVTVNCLECNTPPTISCPTAYNACPVGTYPEPSVTGTATAIINGQNCSGTATVTYTDAVISNGPCANAYNITRTWTATNPNNTSLTSSCTQSIVVADNGGPSITNVPADITVHGNGMLCNVPVKWAAPLASDDCGIASFASNHQSGDNFIEGTTTVVYTAIDNCGNSVNASFNVTVECSAGCTTPPVITCPSNYTACPGGMLPTPSVAGIATATPGSQACVAPFVFYSDFITNFGSCSGAYTAKRTWTAFNPTNGITSTCVQVLQMDDTTPPTFTGTPNNIVVEGTGSGCVVPVNWTAPTASDNCGISNVTSNYNVGTTFSEGTTTVIYTATDNCGNTSTTSFTVTVNCAGCTTPPTISCPANYAACPGSVPTPSIAGVANGFAASSDCTTPVVTFTDAITATGNCTGAVNVTRTWTATDPTNTALSATCLQSISLIDNTNPTISNMPQNILVTATNTNCSSAVTWAVPSANDNCGISSFTSNYTSGHVFADGSTTVTYTATDNCGNTISASFIVTVECAACNTPPVISCPQQYVACPGNSTSPSITGTATAYVNGPNCTGTPSVSYSDATTNNSGCAGGQNIIRTWTAYDGNSGLSTSCTQTINLTDTTPPVISNMPGVISMDGASGNCAVPVTWIAPSATDNCGNVTLTSNYQSGHTFGEGTTTVTYTATDACGNTVSASFVVIITCNECSTPPSIYCPADFTTCATGGGIPGPIQAGFAYSIIDGPYCSGTPYMTYNDVILSSGPCAGAMVVERTWIATDPANKFQSNCVQTLTLADNSAPVIHNMPQDILVTGVGTNCTAYASWNEPNATDDCGLSSLTSNYSNGINFSQGTTTITYTATDLCGNITTATFNVTVQCTAPVCTTPPAITCPTNYTACVSSPSGTAVTGVATASNPDPNCSSVPVVTYQDVINSTGPCAGAQEIYRTWIATDPTTGLNSSCLQVVHLTDTTPPVINNMPSNIVINGTGTGCSLPVTWTVPTATDNCGNNYTPSCNYVVGAVFTEGTTTVTYSATDGCGNVTTASFTVTVICSGCNYPPVISCPADHLTCVTGSTSPSTTGVASAVAGSGCSANPNVTYSDVIISTGPCAGAQHLQRTWTASDPESGLTSACIQNITLEDNTPPVIQNLPGDIVVHGSGAGCGVPVTWTVPTAIDNCGNNYAPTCSYVVGAVFTEGTTTVTYTATDNCGNQTTASFTITVICDYCTTPPVLSCPADYNSCPTPTVPGPSVCGTATATASGTHCGTPVITYNDLVLSSGPCADAKVIQRTWTATDPYDNTLSTSCIQTLSLVDNTPPTLANCPVGIAIQGMYTSTGSGTGSGMGSGGICEGIVVWTAPTATDDCSNVSIVAHDDNGGIVNSGDTFPEGTTVVTYTATDLCGNAATCSFEVVVSCSDDCDTPPILSCPSAATVCINGDYSIAALGNATAIAGANCPAATITSNDVLVSSGPCNGQAVYDRIFTASYPSIPGSQVTCTQTITIADQAPVFTYCPEDIVVADDSTPVSWSAPTLVDPCGNAIVTSTHTAGSTFPCGTTAVTYTATDACGSVITCTFNVIVECVSGNGFAYCPTDMTLSCNGNGGAIANWSEPIYNNTCNDCSVGANIPGFLYMGTYNGSQYYCSISPATWPVAKATCENNGGFLADVNSEEENTFLANMLTTQSAWIGLTDVNGEGNFEWCSGQPVTYTNWYAGQPNNYNNSQDYCELLSTGEWNDQYNNYALEYIMEIPCNYVHQISGPLPGTLLSGGSYTVVYGVTDACNTTETCSFTITVEETLHLTCPSDITVTTAPGQTSAPVTWNAPSATSCCSSCSGTIPGFIYMGSYNGHHYYCSQNPDTWQNAKNNCIANGGNLASINSSGENDYLANILTLQSAWIGGSDLGSEGNFSWCDNSSFNYQNWYPGQPNNYNGGQHCVEMLNNGQWNDQYPTALLEYIMEVPDCINVTQTAGPVSGNHFNVGTTTITYSASDGCGNVQTCSFDVTVEAAGTNPPCSAGGTVSTYHYIDSCTIGNLSNTSGDDGGYGDYTSLCETIEPGLVIPIQLCPGFASGPAHTMFWSVWIDYNQDGDFMDNYEFVAYGQGSQCIDGYITIPASIPNGSCTMRITSKLGGYATDPCANYPFGETEDYCINVINGTLITDDELALRTSSGNDATELTEQATEKDLLQEDILVDIYPNPVSHTMNIMISSPENVSGVTMYDQAGKAVKQLTDIRNEMRVDVTDLAGGMYLLRIEQRNGTQITERVIVTH